MDHQFYPTGAYTSACMWDQFKRPLSHVCDPSAGRGHLLRHAINSFAELPEGKEVPWFETEIEERSLRRNWSYNQRSKYSQIKRVSFVEINPEFHSALKSIEIRNGVVHVIGYDFLTVQSLASVSQVILNPPFRAGAEHVLHAWDLVYDAEISAIINAESIKNPCTEARKRLCGLIEKYGTVKFMQDQFVDDVERVTNVEVALIYLDKSLMSVANIDKMLDGLKVGQNLRGEGVKHEVCTALAIPENFVEHTYRNFAMAVESARKFCEYQAVFDMKDAALGLDLAQMQAKGVGSEFREDMTQIQSKASAAFLEIYDNLKRKAWSQIIRSSLLTDKLSNQARRKVEAQAGTIYELEFSVPNVYGFLEGVMQSMGDIFQDMVCQLFDTICERSSDNVSFYKSWKSNQRHKVGMKIRQKRFIIPGFHVYSGCRLQYESKQFLSDIDKVFGLLDGVTTPFQGVTHAFESGLVSAGERVSTEYFDIRYFAGAGTIHFFAKSPEVVDRLNRFVGRVRNWIPQQMEEANADFQKQFNDSEKLTPSYVQRFKGKSSKSYYWRDPVHAACGERETEDSKRHLQELVDSIEEAHAELGISCGVALENSGKVTSILIEHSAKVEPLAICAPANQSGEQMQLLAA